MNLTHAPLRAATGAFILNSGLTKAGRRPRHGAAACTASPPRRTRRCRT
ncbi:hypothetical protein [Nocardioides convexus]|nr:hypothetical protein [Nocardioides convexus]